jgi:serine/threonine protein kinase
VQAVTAAAAAASRRRGRSSSSTAGGRLQALPLSVSEVLRIAVDVASAMQYLHNMQPQVVHRDLKPQNVLLDLQGCAKVRRMPLQLCSCSTAEQSAAACWASCMCQLLMFNA